MHTSAALAAALRASLSPTPPPPPSVLPPSVLPGPPTLGFGFDPIFCGMGALDGWFVVEDAPSTRPGVANGSGSFLEEREQRLPIVPVLLSRCYFFYCSRLWIVCLSPRVGVM